MSALPAIDQFRHAQPLLDDRNDAAGVLEDLQQWAEIAPSHDKDQGIFDEIDAASLQVDQLDEKRFSRPVRAVLFVTLSIASWGVVLAVGHMVVKALHR